MASIPQVLVLPKLVKVLSNPEVAGIASGNKLFVVVVTNPSKYKYTRLSKIPASSPKLYSAVLSQVMVWSGILSALLKPFTTLSAPGKPNS